jgi:hypothetical protein
MNLIRTKIWNGSAFVGEVALEDSAPLTSMAQVPLTLGQAVATAGVPSVLGSSLGSTPQLLWPSGGATSPYYGMLHDLRWYSTFEISLNNPRDPGAPPAPSAVPWGWIGAGAVVLLGVVAYVNRRAFT